MITLGLDIGSSAVKAALLREGRVVSPLARIEYPTTYLGPRVEVNPAALLAALRKAIAAIGPAARKVDCIGLSVMSPAWIAMDARGRALTPLVTHQDRRSVECAVELEQRLGRQRHLHLAGNRPIPGGTSSTTYLWYKSHHPALLKRADLVGHLNTYLHRQLTGARVIDPGNASFTGLYSTLQLSGWNDELCHAVGIRQSILPEVIDGNRLAGQITRNAAHEMNLREGTPMTAGLVDTSAAMLHVGAKPGQLLNVSGATDVLALCTNHPKPHERLITRALGVGRLWMSVSTLAAAGSSLDWARQNLFPDLSPAQFRKCLTKLPDSGGVSFDPYLAGDRMAIEQPQAAFHGLTLATSRHQMLSAIVESLAAASAQRLPLLRHSGTPIRRTVYISGGAHRALAGILYRDWPGKWIFKTEADATLRGLSSIAPQER